MIVLRKGTQKAQGFIRSYEGSDYTRLRQVYGSYSFAKECAEYKCLQSMNDMGGSDFRIISHNTFGFSCAYIVDRGNGTKALIIHTPSNVYCIEEYC